MHFRNCFKKLDFQNSGLALAYSRVPAQVPCLMLIFQAYEAQQHARHLKPDSHLCRAKLHLTIRQTF